MVHSIPPVQFSIVDSSLLNQLTLTIVKTD